MKAIRLLARKLAVSPEYLETGRDLAPREERELRLGDLELELRLERSTPEAERELQELAAEAERDGDGAASARARRMLGLALHRRGRFREAIEHLEPVVESGRFSPVTEPGLYTTLGHAYSSTDRPEQAVALFERCLEEIEERDPNDDVAHVRFATYLSYALSDAGDLRSARRVLARALERTSGGLDPYSRIRLHWSRARLASSDQDPQTALRELRRAIALLETTEDVRQLGRAHILHAELLTLEGQTDSAARSLGTAERLLGESSDREDLYWLRTEQARCAAAGGRGEEAIARASEALELIGDGDPAEQGAALWALGQGLELSDRAAESIDPLERAVDLLEAQSRLREASQAAKALAASLRRLERDDDAFRALERAAGLAARIGETTAQRA